MSRFDVITVNKETKRVTGFVAFSVPMQTQGYRTGASEVCEEIQAKLKTEIAAVIVPECEHIVGDFMPIQKHSKLKGMFEKK